MSAASASSGTCPTRPDPRSAWAPPRSSSSRRGSSGRAGGSWAATSGSAATSWTSSASIPVRRAALVVVEVRWRGRRDFGLAEESLDRRKRAAIRRATGTLLAAGALPDGTPLPRLPWRIDLVAVDPGPGGEPVDPPPPRLPAVIGRPARTRATLRAATDGPWRHQRPSRPQAGAEHTRGSWSLAGRCRQRTRSRARRRPRRGSAEAQPQEALHVPTVSMRQLLEAGVHFGHQTRRWNPKMRPYIFAERNGIHIIDLAQTVKRLDTALEFVTRDRRPRRERAVRRHQEAGAGAGRCRRRSAPAAVRQQALARRHADQLRDHQEAHRPARPARGPAARRRLRPAAQEGGRAADRGAEQAPAHARRHPQDEAPAGRDLHRRPAPRAHRGRPRPTSSRSRSSARATPTSTRTSSTTSSRPTTTRSAPSGCCARSSRTPRSRAPSSARRAPRASPRCRGPVGRRAGVRRDRGGRPGRRARGRRHAVVRARARRRGPAARLAARRGARARARRPPRRPPRMPRPRTRPAD